MTDFRSEQLDYNYLPNKSLIKIAKYFITIFSFFYKVFRIFIYLLSLFRKAEAAANPEEEKGPNDWLSELRRTQKRKSIGSVLTRRGSAFQM